MGMAPDDPYVPSMVTLHIEHPITDCGTWRAAFDAFAPARRAAGVRDERISRPVGDEQYIVVDLDFDGPAPAAAFERFLRSQVWASPDSAPALVGSPRTAILERASADSPAPTPASA
jgi:hypothetical protein